MNDPWQRMLLLVNEYASHFCDAALHQAESRADVSRTAALKTLGKIRAALVEHSKTVAEAERHACSIAVWMTLQDALEPDADDMGLDGWMREAEARIKARP